MKLSTFFLTTVYSFSILNNLFLYRNNAALKNILLVLTIGAMIVATYYLVSKFKVQRADIYKFNKYIFIYFILLFLVQVFYHGLQFRLFLQLIAYAIVGLLAYVYIPYVLYSQRQILMNFLKIVAIFSAFLAFTALWSNLGFRSFFGLPLSDKYAYSFLGLHATGGILDHPLTLGTQLVLGMGCAYHLFRIKSSPIYAALFVIMAIGLLLSMARGAFLGFGVAALYYLLPAKILRQRYMTFMIIPIVAVLFLAWFYHFAESSEYLRTLLRLGAGLSDREILWAVGLALIASQPLVGYGFLQSPRLLAESGAIHLTRTMQPGVVFPFHNTFIDNAVDSGVVVTLVYLLLFIIPLFRVAKYCRDNALAKLLFSLSIAMLASAIFVNYNIGGVRSVSFTMAIVLGLANWSILEKPIPRRRQPPS